MKYVAFLRGINVGGRIIKMVDLKKCFELAGFEDVSTILQTGNVIFSSHKDEQSLKTQIEEILAGTFNYPAKVQVLSLDNLRRVVEASPYKQIDGNTHSYIIFMEEAGAKDLMAEAKNVDEKIEEISSGEGVIYWKVRKGMTIKSPFSKYLTKAKYKNINTNRNIQTLHKIIGLASS